MRPCCFCRQSIKHFEETMTHFQRQKLEDVKNIFREFLTVEMLFHAKALEVFSHTYQNMEAMNAEKDLEVCFSSEWYDLLPSQLFTGRIRMLDSQMWPLERSISSRSPPPTAHYSSLPLGSWRGRALDSPETSDHSRRQQPSQHHGSVSTVSLSMIWANEEHMLDMLVFFTASHQPKTPWRHGGGGASTGRG
uniref:Protein FAM92A1-like n=1 Tax=Cyprinodon variegatus TaxID=28743 RepID=A0A3Q2DDK1_CYPVA